MDRGRIQYLLYLPRGEVAWIYAQALRCLCALTGATCISMYPYQLGHGNDEAIESGAFWFYRKLGFRPGRADLLALTEREELENGAPSRASNFCEGAAPPGGGPRFLRIARKPSWGMGHVRHPQHWAEGESTDG